MADRIPLPGIEWIPVALPNPDRRWWQVWKPRTIPNPVWVGRMNAWLADMPLMGSHDG